MKNYNLQNEDKYKLKKNQEQNITNIKSFMNKAKKSGKKLFICTSLITLLTGCASQTIPLNNTLPINSTDKENTIESPSNNNEDELVVKPINEELSQETNEEKPIEEKIEMATEKQSKETIVNDNYTIKYNNGFTIVSKYNIEKTDKINELEKKIDSLIKKSDKRYSFYITSPDGYSMGYNYNTKLFAGCVGKIGIATYAMTEIEKGNASLNDILVYQQKHARGGSGTIQNLAFGTKLTLEDVIYRLLHISDNVALVMLEDYFGVENYNKWLRDNGFTNMQLLNGQVFGSYTTIDMANFWNYVYEYSKKSEEGKHLWKIVTESKYAYARDVINRSPNKLIVGSKSGWTPEVLGNGYKVIGYITDKNGNTFEINYGAAVFDPANRAWFDEAVKLLHELAIEISFQIYKNDYNQKLEEEKENVAINKYTYNGNTYAIGENPLLAKIMEEENNKNKSRQLVKTKYCA